MKQCKKMSSMYSDVNIQQLMSAISRDDLNEEIPTNSKKIKDSQRFMKFLQKFYE